LVVADKDLYVGGVFLAGWLPVRAEHRQMVASIRKGEVQMRVYFHWVWAGLLLGSLLGLYTAVRPTPAVAPPPTGRIY